jgi:hypothetical protein
MKRVLATLALAICATSLISCSGNAKDHYRVTGQVFCDGEPAEGVDLLFHLKGDGDTDPHVPHGSTDSSGVYTLICKDGNGAPPGEYFVTIRWLDYQSPEGKKHKGKNTVRFKNYPEDILKGKYSDNKKPVFFATVTTGNNEVPRFDISRKGIEKSYLSSN